MYKSRGVFFSLFLLVIPIFTPVTAVALETLETNVESRQFIPVIFHTKDGDIPSTAALDSLKIIPNPKKLAKITKTTSWKHHDIQGLDAPEEQFTSGEPYRLEVELFFDGYEEKKSVREYIDAITKQHKIRFTWANSPFRGKIENFSVKYTEFLDDDTPVRAIMNTTFKEFKPAEAEAQTRSNYKQNIREFLDASRQSLKLLKKYDAVSLSEVAKKVFANFETEKKNSIEDSNSNTMQPDQLQQVKGFKIEISGTGNSKKEDNAWETVTGGSLNIELTETTIGSDKFHATTPGHKSIGEISLKGPLAKQRKSLVNWLNTKTCKVCEDKDKDKDEDEDEKKQLSKTAKDINKGVDERFLTCKTCKTVKLSFYDQNNNTLNEFQLSVLDAYFFKNEIFLFYIQNDRLHASVLNIIRKRSDGSLFSGLPKILAVLPASGPAFMPLGIVGINFEQGTIPYINKTPSLALFNFSVKNLPLIGQISIGVTIVPPAAPSGSTSVSVEYFGQRSNPFPFTVR